MAEHDVFKLPDLPANFARAFKTRPAGLNDYQFGYDDFASFLDAVQDTATRTVRNQSQTYPASSSWDDCAGYDGALRFAARGWPEGRERYDMAIAAMPKSGRAKTRDEGHDVCGERPDIIRAVAGDPRSMIGRGKSRKTRQKIIRIIVNAATSYGIDARLFTNRGLCVAQLVDSLESAGYRTEILLIDNSLGSGTDRPVVCGSIMVKAAGEALDTDRMLFMLAHPAAFRRLMFRMVELDPTASRLLGSGYGIASDIFSAGTEPGEDDIYFPCITDNGHNFTNLGSSAMYATPASTQAIIERILSDYIG